MIMVTPEGEYFRGRVDMVEFPSDAGELGILPGHVPLLVGLSGGELRVYRQGDLDRYAVAGGFVQVQPGELRVMATFAATGAELMEIDLACQRARKALEAATEEDPVVIAGELAALRSEMTRLSYQWRLKRRKQS